MEKTPSTLSIETPTEVSSSQVAGSSVVAETPLSATRTRMSQVLKRVKKSSKSFIRKRRPSSKTAAAALEGVVGSPSFSEASVSSISYLESSLTVATEEDVDIFLKEEPEEASSSTRADSEAVVVHGQPTSTLASPSVSARRTTVALRKDIDDWFYNAHALLTSKEMHSFLKSSNRVLTSAVRTSAGTALTASGLVVKTAFLPVTLPLNVAASTTDLVINMVGEVLHHAICDGDHKDKNGIDGEDEEDGVYHTPAQDLLHNVFNFIPFIVHNTMNMVTPALGMQEKERRSAELIRAERHRSRQRTERPTTAAARATDSGSSSSEASPDDFLARLRLDIQPEKNMGRHMNGDYDDDDATTGTDSSDTSAQGNPSGASKADFSKFLLRVDDVNVLAPPNPASDKVLRALYVDLDTEFGDESITKEALSQLIQRGLDISCSNSAVEVFPVNNNEKSQIIQSVEIEWKPQGNVKKEMKKLSQLPQSEFYEALKSQVLIWSGKYCGPRYHGSGSPLFMARGVVNGSPRDFTMMLWDSTRTREYNNYCLGRKDVIVINDDISHGGLSGAKVIKSETKIPFTSLSVFLSAVMHAKALGGRPEDGYIIFSRSLDTGRAGCHVGTTKMVDQSNKNEIILGVNIMRPVPGHPDLTDLISVSQVSASMVPPFLAFKIGMMGVEDFFKNVRS